MNAASPSTLLIAYANRGAVTSEITTGASSAVGTGTTFASTPPAYTSLVEAKNTLVPGSTQSTRYRAASVFVRTTRAGSPTTLRTPTTAASRYT
jgi:hypothetical protein